MLKPTIKCQDPKTVPILFKSETFGIQKPAIKTQIILLIHFLPSSTSKPLRAIANLQHKIPKPPNPSMANQAATIPPQDDDHQVVESTAENINIIKLALKSNNVQVLLDPNTYQQDYRVMIEFLQYHPLNRALTLANPNVPEIYVQEVWQTLYVHDEETMYGSFGHPVTPEDAVSIPFTRRKIARLFQLPQPIVEIEGQKVPNPDLEPYPTTEALLAFITHLGYNKILTILSEFKRKKLPPIWNVLVSILNKSLTCKTGSMD